MYRSRVDVKVLGNVGLGFVRANFPSSRDVGFAAPECRLVRASNSITVIGAQKCSFYLACLRYDCARVQPNITLASSLANHGASRWQLCPKTPAEKRRTIRYRQHLFSRLNSCFFLDSVVGFSYYLEIFMHPIALPATEARELLMPIGIKRWRSV
jgi:hypothetical protein